MEDRAASMPVDEPGQGNGNDNDGTGSPALALPSRVKEGQEQEQEDEQTDGGLVLDDTSEFIRNMMSSRQAVAPKREREKQVNGNSNGNGTPAAPVPRPRVKAEPKEEDVPLDELVAQDGQEEGEDGDEAMEPDEPEEGEFGFGRDEDERKPSLVGGVSDGPDGFGSTAGEALVSSGMASTLQLLKQSGLVKPLTEDEIARDAAYRERERFVTETRIREAELQASRARSKAAGASKDQAQREYENKQRQYEHAQKQLEAFKTYKPNVEITYTDEFGRALTPKEAWKDLSHKFHGKGSGTNKREKLLKRIAEEKKRVRRSIRMGIVRDLVVLMSILVLVWLFRKLWPLATRHSRSVQPSRPDRSGWGPRRWCSGWATRSGSGFRFVSDRGLVWTCDG